MNNLNKPRRWPKGQLNKINKKYQKQLNKESRRVAEVEKSIEEWKQSTEGQWLKARCLREYYEVEQEMRKRLYRVFKPTYFSAK